MRICTRCKKTKPIDEFNFKIKARNVRQYHCRNCSRLYVQNHYKKNIAYYLAKAKKRNQINKTAIKDYIWGYYRHNPCVDCGESDPNVLEFDHLSDKIAAVSKMYRNYTLNKVKEEIEKCQVRCANCHRRKTAKQFGWYKKNMPL